MGRAAVHSEDDFLDAAAALFAASGERGLTMTSVTQHLGASNGSIYHRFPERAALLAALWLRTSRKFQQAYFDVLDDPPTVEGVVTAAAWVVDWCRDHLDEALVLQAGVRAFSPDEWPEAARSALNDLDSATQHQIARALQVVAKQTGLPRDQVAFAMLDLPLAAIRRYLLAGKPPPRRVTELVRSLTRTVLETAGR